MFSLTPAIVWKGRDGRYAWSPLHGFSMCFMVGPLPIYVGWFGVQYSGTGACVFCKVDGFGYIVNEWEKNHWGHRPAQSFWDSIPIQQRWEYSEELDACFPD